MILTLLFNIYSVFNVNKSMFLWRIVHIYIFMLLCRIFLTFISTTIIIIIAIVNSGSTRHILQFAVCAYVPCTL